MLQFHSWTAQNVVQNKQFMLLCLCFATMCKFNNLNWPEQNFSNGNATAKVWRKKKFSQPEKHHVTMQGIEMVGYECSFSERTIKYSLQSSSIFMVSLRCTACELSEWRKASILSMPLIAFSGQPSFENLIKYISFWVKPLDYIVHHQLYDYVNWIKSLLSWQFVMFFFLSSSSF